MPTLSLGLHAHLRFAHVIWGSGVADGSTDLDGVKHIIVENLNYGYDKPSCMDLKVSAIELLVLQPLRKA
jgi:hypothetical protein